MSTPLSLPSPEGQGVMSLAAAIARRRSVRDFTAESISQAHLSQILWASQGITNASRKSRSIPSAGATYPLDCGRRIITFHMSKSLILNEVSNGC